MSLYNVIGRSKTYKERIKNRRRGPVKAVDKFYSLVMITTIVVEAVDMPGSSQLEETGMVKR